MGNLGFPKIPEEVMKAGFPGGVINSLGRRSHFLDVRNEAWGATLAM